MKEAVYAEDGEGFQEYVTDKGERVKAGTLIGYEDGDTLELLPHIRFSPEPRTSEV
jgi:hypothetical protein